MDNNIFNPDLIETASFTPRSLEWPNSWCGHLPFAAWLINVLKPAVFVELGTHTGNSYFTFCQAVRNANLNSKCYAVDTWAGDEHAGYYGDEVYQKVNHHNELNYARFSRLMRMTFDEALDYFSDGSIELLHIDGLHTYEAVRHDFDSWRPKLASNAIVLLHDINVRERNFGVWRLWEELREEYPNNMEFTHSHGLGVLQLDGGTDTKGLPFLKPDYADKDRLSRYFAGLGERHINASDVATLHQVIAERDEQIATLNQAVAERDKQVAQLSANISALLNSLSWRITKPLRYVRTAITALTRRPNRHL